MQSLIDSARTFPARAADRHVRLGHLADGHRPEVMFITCSDSRIVPSLITDASPVQVFELRTAGHIVPAYRSWGVSPWEAASVAFAVEVLEVRDIVGCGHSHRGTVGAPIGGGDLLFMKSLALSARSSGSLLFIKSLTLLTHSAGGSYLTTHSAPSSGSLLCHAGPPRLADVERTARRCRGGGRPGRRGIGGGRTAARPDPARPAARTSVGGASAGGRPARAARLVLRGRCRPGQRVPTAVRRVRAALRAGAR